MAWIVNTENWYKISDRLDSGIYTNQTMAFILQKSNSLGAQLSMYTYHYNHLSSNMPE
jgi:hypothetical protein